MKILITVMTYPHPSRKYDELLCTAGISETGEWVRLYPIDYRYRPLNQQFKKYQWIEVGVSSRNNDTRPESREPYLDTLRILGEPLSPRNHWQERREIVDKIPVHTLNQLKELYNEQKVSLGVVRPESVIDLEITPTESDWKPEWKHLYEELKLFETRPKKTLRKIPFKFTYVFRCEDTANKPHRATITDWELGVLWLREVKRLGDENQAAESVRGKYLEEICRADKDTRFFMGTALPYNTWMVLGAFWPPKLPVDQQASLFW